MIFDNGVTQVDRICTFCGRTHYNFQIGEESMVCRCGAMFVIVSSDPQNILYMEIHPLDAKDQATNIFNDDPRMLN